MESLPRLAWHHRLHWPSFSLGCALGLATRPRFSVAFQVFSLLAGLLGWLGFSHYLYGGGPLLPFGRWRLTRRRRF